MDLSYDLLLGLMFLFLPRKAIGMMLVRVSETFLYSLFKTGNAE